MKYIMQIIAIIVVFIICNREKTKFIKASNDKYYDFGVYKLNPLRGDVAVKKAKIGLFLSTIIPWLFVIVFAIYDFKSLN